MGYKVILSTELSGDRFDKRYMVVDSETGEVLDDAQGYGYKSPQKAYAAWGYKHQSPQKKAQKGKTEKAVRKWLEAHQEFDDDLCDAACHVLKGSYGPDAKIDLDSVRGFFGAYGIKEEDLPFSIKEFFSVWINMNKYTEGSF